MDVYVCICGHMWAYFSRRLWQLRCFWVRYFANYGQTQPQPHAAQTDRQTDRPTDGPSDRPTDRQTDIQTDRHTDRQTDRQTDRLTNRRTARHKFSEEWNHWFAACGFWPWGFWGCGHSSRFFWVLRPISKSWPNAIYTHSMRIHIFIIIAFGSTALGTPSWFWCGDFCHTTNGNPPYIYIYMIYITSAMVP